MALAAARAVSDRTARAVAIAAAPRRADFKSRVGTWPALTSSLEIVGRSRGRGLGPAPIYRRCGPGVEKRQRRCAPDVLRRSRSEARSNAVRSAPQARCGVNAAAKRRSRTDTHRRRWRRREIRRCRREPRPASRPPTPSRIVPARQRAPTSLECGADGVAIGRRADRPSGRPRLSTCRPMRLEWTCSRTRTKVCMKAVPISPPNRRLVWSSVPIVSTSAGFIDRTARTTTAVSANDWPIACKI